MAADNTVVDGQAFVNLFFGKGRFKNRFKFPCANTCANNA